MAEREQVLELLVQLSRSIAEPAKRCVIYGEGNTSAKIDEHHFLVKASGVSMVDAKAEDFVEMSTDAVLGIVEAGRIPEAEVGRRLDLARIDRSTSVRPSVETMMHALLIQECGALFVGHTHPTSVNAILCSKQAKELLSGWLLPEHIIFLGPEALFVPYCDPGIKMAIGINDGIKHFVKRNGAPPKSILLQNHGLIVAGKTPAEVATMTDMWVKACDILLGTLVAGGPNFLPDGVIAGVLSRDDTKYHREKAV